VNRLLDARDRSLLLGAALALTVAVVGILAMAAALGLAVRIFVLISDL
jgi:hypothetical protein